MTIETQATMMGLLVWMLAMCAGALVLLQDAGAQEAPATQGVLAEAPAPEVAAVDGVAVANKLEPSGIPCKPSASRRRFMHLTRALAGGFGVQYWGEDYTAEGLTEQPHGLLIIEVAKVGALHSESGREVFFTSDEIAIISRDGERPVLGYLNVSEIENYRDYWIDFVMQSVPDDSVELPQWYGPHAGHGDHLAAYWMPAWRDVILARVDRLMESGIDGLFLDDVLHYYSYAKGTNLRWPRSGWPEGPRDAPGLARAMMELVVAIAERVREWNCNALVFANNGVFIGRDAAEALTDNGTKSVFDSYRDAIDAVTVENVLSPMANPSTRVVVKSDFLDYGLKVLTLDVVSRAGTEDFTDLRQTLAKEAQITGFYPYLVEDHSFNRLWAPIALHGKE